MNATGSLRTRCGRSSIGHYIRRRSLSEKYASEVGGHTNLWLPVAEIADH
jgi:hypothetical protein